MLFNNTFLCILGDIFGFIGKFFKINIFNILTGQKRDMTELKLVWPVNTTGHRSKIILSPAHVNVISSRLYIPNDFFFTIFITLPINWVYSQTK